MLTQWKLNNFKSIKELPNDFSLGPVTLLAGANSSGKTVLLQSILLIAQTLSSPVATRALVLNGEFVKLGIWTDIPHNDLQDEPVTIEFTIDLPRDYSIYGISRRVQVRQHWPTRQPITDNITRVKVRASFSRINRGKDPIAEPCIECIEMVVEEYVAAETSRKKTLATSSITVRRRKKAHNRKDLNEWIPLLPVGITQTDLDYMVIESRPPPPLQDSERFESYEEWAVPRSTIGSTFSLFLPRRKVQRVDATAEQLYQNIHTLVSPSYKMPASRQASSQFTKFIKNTMLNGSDTLPEPLIARVNTFVEIFSSDLSFKGSTPTELTYFLRSLRSTLRNRRLEHAFVALLTEELRDFINEEAKSVGIRSTPMPDFARAAATILKQFFSSYIRYLGPLRDDPKVIYALPPTPDIPDVGVKGQYTAVVLDRNKNELIQYIDPGTQTKKQCSLQEAVVAWLKHMEMLQSVSTKEEGKLGYTLTVKTPGLDRELDLTTVGVGVSQVLPILVMALLAPEGALLIFEQPEIHLHPKVQSILGDFFLSMGQLGKQCLVETHSEYLVNRMRDRIAESQDDKVLKLFKIYFVDRIGNESLFRGVEANEYGAIHDWPVGFFDEGTLQSESIIRHATEKRRRKEISGK